MVGYETIYHYYISSPRERNFYHFAISRYFPVRDIISLNGGIKLGPTSGALIICKIAFIRIRKYSQNLFVYSFLLSI